VRRGNPAKNRHMVSPASNWRAAAAEVSRRAAEEIERGWGEVLGAERLTELKTPLTDLVAGLERDAAPGLDPPETRHRGGTG
jgi:hypothetical protein